MAPCWAHADFELAHIACAFRRSLLVLAMGIAAGSIKKCLKGAGAAQSAGTLHQWQPPPSACTQSWNDWQPERAIVHASSSTIPIHFLTITRLPG